jgi:5'-3' exonuclease
MGINNLYKVINEIAPSSIRKYPLSRLRGYRVAIDISIFLYKYIRSAGDRYWMGTFILLLCTLKKHGIKAVCVFDGPNPPIEKQQERVLRRETTKKIRDRMERCKQMIEEASKMSGDFDTEIPIEFVEECKTLIRPRRGYYDNTNYEDIHDIVSSLHIVVDRLKKQSDPITDEHPKMAIKIVKMLGLSYYQADGEAETLCSYLALKGEVDAVLTEDTDVLVYGTPLMIAFKDNKLTDEMVYCISFERLLKESELSMAEFQDLCILLRCDYNKHTGSIKGFPPDGKKRKKAVNIGMVGALAFIQELRCIEKIQEYIEDISPLKHERCRHIFTDFSMLEDINVVPLNAPPDVDKLNNFIRENRLNVTLEYIMGCWKPSDLEFESSYDSECSKSSSEISSSEESEENSSEEKPKSFSSHNSSPKSRSSSSTSRSKK